MYYNDLHEDGHFYSLNQSRHTSSTIKSSWSKYDPTKVQTHSLLDEDNCNLYTFPYFDKSTSSNIYGLLVRLL